MANDMQALVGQAFSLPDFCHRLLGADFIANAVYGCAAMRAPAKRRGTLIERRTRCSQF
jgi:hypothetical protein